LSTISSLYLPSCRYYRCLDDVEDPELTSSESSGSKFRFWDRQGLSSVLQGQDVSIAVTPNGWVEDKVAIYASLYAKEADFINRTSASLADSVQYDEKTKEEYFAMPLTLDMTIDKLFDKLGRHLAHFTSAWLLTRPC